MSIFTNDDLTRLKEAKREGFYEYFKMDDLLARMEAAEKVCFQLMGVEDMIKIPLVLGDDSRERAMQRLNTAFRAWREASGK